MKKEEAIKRLTDMHKFSGLLGLKLEDRQALSMGIDALEQQPILDKIKAEIEQITDTMGVSYNQYVNKIDVLRIINKYRESEDEE